MADAAPTDQPTTGTISPEERFNLADRLLGLALHHLVSKFEADPGSLNASAFAEVVKLLTLYQRFHADADSSGIKGREEFAKLLADLPTFGDTAPAAAGDSQPAATDGDDSDRHELENQYQEAIRAAPPLLD